MVHRSTAEPALNFLIFGDCEPAVLDSHHAYLLTSIPTVLQMTHYDEDDNRVTVHFDRGQPSVHAKVLVGADGYFSRIRTQCLNDGPPLFAVGNSNISWRGA